MQAIVLTVICVSGMCLGMVAHGQEGFRTALEKIRSTNIVERNQGVATITRERDYVVKELINIAREEQDREASWTPGATVKNCALRALGRLRASEAIPILIESIAPKKGQSGVIEETGVSPAYSALIEIGVPATDKLLDEVAGEGSKFRREMCCRVLEGVYTRPIAAQVVRERLKKEDKPERVERLSRAVLFFERTTVASEIFW